MRWKFWARPAPAKRRRLDAERKRTIGQALERGDSIEELAVKWGVSQSSIRRCKLVAGNGHDKLAHPAPLVLTRPVPAPDACPVSFVPMDLSEEKFNALWPLIAEVESVQDEHAGRIQLLSKMATAGNLFFDVLDIEGRQVGFAGFENVMPSHGATVHFSFFDHKPFGREISVHRWVCGFMGEFSLPIIWMTVQSDKRTTPLFMARMGWQFDGRIRMALPRPGGKFADFLLYSFCMNDQARSEEEVAQCPG